MYRVIIFLTTLLAISCSNPMFQDRVDRDGYITYILCKDGKEYITDVNNNILHENLNPLNLCKSKKESP